MTSLHTEHETDEEYQNMSRRHDSEPDREISLNTSTILLIFFALAIVCSAFFGLGYTMGRKTPITYAATTTEDHTESLRDAFKSFKPAPGGPTSAKSTAASATEPKSDDTESSNSVAAPAPASVAKAAAPAAVKKAFDPDAEIVTDVPPSRTNSLPAHPITPASAPSEGGSVVVQVAAVSHQEDADTMLAALKRKGYTVAIHHEPQDRLLHLQLGPYGTRKDAEAMRTRLLADGYNSILK